VIPKHQSFGEKYIVLIIKSSAIMCINVYAIFKGTVMRVKCKILFSPFISHHICAIGMFHVSQKVGGKGHCTAAFAKCSQNFLLEFHF